MEFLSKSSFWAPDYLVESAWHEHAPFAFWLTEMHRPSTFVELGTHHGFSYCCFCQAIERLGLETKAFAVDTWTGDDHAGLYGEEVFKRLSEYHNRYNAFSRLVRSSFDEALSHFPDASIDLLHIDGRHFYEDVKHDFASWTRKLSSRAIVLFHDTNVRERGFGVFQFWQEISSNYRAFEFLHGHGLGVLAFGPHQRPELNAFFDAVVDPQRALEVRTTYSCLGAAVARKWQLTQARNRITAQSAQLAEVQGNITALEKRIADKDQQITISRQQLAEAQGKIAALEKKIADQDQQITTSQQQLAEAQGKITALEKRIADQDQQITTSQQQLAEIMSSLSWRLTAPFRKLYAVIARMRTSRFAVKLAAALRHPTNSRKRKTYRIRHMPQFSPVALPARKPRSFSHEFCRPTALLLSGEEKTPGHVYRIERHADAMRKAGFSVSTLTMDEIDRFWDRAGRADLLMIWRAPWSDKLAAFVDRARSGGAKVIFDLDDLMIDPEIANEKNIDAIRMNKMKVDDVRGHFSRVQATMKHADLCTASTRELAWHMLRMGRPAIVLPNGFDEDTYHRSHLARRKRQKGSTDGLFRIGYAGGTRTHQADLRQCIGAIADFLRARPDARLVLFRKGELPIVELAEFAEMKGLESQIEWREVVPLRDLPDEIARFDINLAPLEVGNPFCEAKSELKIFEAALAHVCTVASPTGPFARLVRHGATGLLARTPAEWRDALFTLANDPKMREGLALAAELSVLWPHGPMRRRNAVATLLDHASGGRAATLAMRLHITEQEKASAWAPPVTGRHKIVFEADKLKASRVTVVVPLYNYEHYVIEALDSVAAQSLTDLDLVVVDDASTDASLARVLDWARAHAERFNRILVVSHLENYGLGTARNTGFALACSLWIMALDADNRLKESCCARCLEVADASGAAFVYPIIQRFGNQTGTFGGEPFMPARMQGGNSIDAMALISKEAWAAVGGYSSMRLGWEDYDFWLRLIEHGLHGEPIPEVLAEYRVHSKSMLRTITDKLDNKKALIQYLEREHPWVRIT